MALKNRQLGQKTKASNKATCLFTTKFKIENLRVFYGNQPMFHEKTGLGYNDPLASLHNPIPIRSKHTLGFTYLVGDQPLSWSWSSPMEWPRQSILSSSPKYGLPKLCLRFHETTHVISHHILSYNIFMGVLR